MKFVKKSNLINCNPIENSIYNWRNVKVNLGENCSHIEIEQDGKKIYVNGSFFTDDITVINNAMNSNKKLFDKIVLNIIGTSNALPNGGLCDEIDVQPIKYKDNV